MGVAAAILARRPVFVPMAVLIAAPFRPPLSFDSSGSFLVSVADDGRLGRLLPLYFVLAAAGAALGWRALRGRELRPLPLGIAAPAAAFFAFACLSLTWADDLEAGTNLIVFFTLPFALLLATVARADFPAPVPRALAAAALVLASLFAVVGLWQAATRELFFYAPNLAVSNANTDYFRVTSLFGDPSLYGQAPGARHRGRARAAGLPALEAVAARGGARAAVDGAVLLLLPVEHGRTAGGDAGARPGHR